MKKTFHTLLCAAAAVVVLALTAGLTSCDNDGWYPEHPNSLNYYFDPGLTGYWQLSQVNGQKVNQADANYLYFNGDGEGYYYFLDEGLMEIKPITYDCQGCDSAISQTQLNINYGQWQAPRSMVYWLDNSLLCMQWVSGDTVTTYVYQAIGSAPW